MARRLEIARALLHTPDVLFLDEPTVGLDPQTRARMWEDVLRLRDEEGAAVFFTTHYMDEAEYADRIAIIDHGAIVALDTPAALKAAVGADTVHLRTTDDATAAARLQAAGFEVKRSAPGEPRAAGVSPGEHSGAGVSTGEHGLVVTVADGERAVGALVPAAGVTVERVRVHTPDLDDVFLHFTGRQIREHPDGQSLLRRFATARRR
jgi:ABC-2 type transport system ATP-binding protein